LTVALLKGAAVWLLLVAVAIGNDVVRDRLLEPLASPAVALALSGLLL